MSNVIEQNFNARTPKGDKTGIGVVIGTPYLGADGIWACPVPTPGLDGEYPDIRGDDALQALCLALSLVRQRLTHFLENGGRLFEGDGKNASEWNLEILNSMFSGVGRNPEA